MAKKPTLFAPTTWRYGIVEHDDASFGLYVVYFEKGGYVNRTKNPITVSDTVRGITLQLYAMLKDCEKPVLHD